MSKESFNESVKKYHKKAYRKYMIMLHNEKHKDLIEIIEQNRSQGISATQTFIKAMNKKDK